MSIHLRLRHKVTGLALVSALVPVLALLVLLGWQERRLSSLTLDQFPTPKQLWSKYCKWKGITPDEEEII